jgi:hypothetical protein
MCTAVRNLQSEDFRAVLKIAKAFYRRVDLWEHLLQRQKYLAVWLFLHAHTTGAY